MDKSLTHLTCMHYTINGRYSQTENLMNVQAICSWIFSTTSSQVLETLLSHPRTEEEIEYRGELGRKIYSCLIGREISHATAGIFHAAS